MPPKKLETDADGFARVSASPSPTIRYQTATKAPGARAKKHRKGRGLKASETVAPDADDGDVLGGAGGRGSTHDLDARLERLRGTLKGRKATLAQGAWWPLWGGASLACLFPLVSHG